MMDKKIVVIPDVHGRTGWKKAIEKEPDVDLYLFIGDYLDSFDVPITKQIDNFQDIIEFKKKYSDKVVLLVGNHCLHYIINQLQYSGWNSLTHLLAQPIYNDNKDLFKVIHIEGDYLFSHAGITKTWLGDLKLEDLNELFWTKPVYFDIFWGGNAYGDDPRNGPLWVRPYSLIDNAIEGYIQVVGHTQNHPNRYDKFIFVDRPDYYLVLEDCKRTFKKYKE